MDPPFLIDAHSHINFSPDLVVKIESALPKKVW